MMTKILRLPEDFWHELVYMLTVPFFFIGFTLLYNPFDIKGYLVMGGFGYGFHLMMIASIILLTLMITRGTLFLIIKKFDLKWLQYVSWCLGEMLVASCFSALYIVLFERGGDYFQSLSTAMKFIYPVVIWPYVLLMMVQIIDNKDDEIEAAVERQDNSLVRFYDEHKRLKLTIAPSSLLYVGSESNYVKICYQESGRVREFLLRASMKSIEGSRGLVRCHRSYFVNPAHVKVLRKDSDGLIYAEMNIAEIPPVPVSKQYYQSLSSLL
ncbi:MAG: LytTR family transcriptional regulator [Bacteroidales bacterium]|nr:LytTR family transcriptional regulator [Bacteroidales bacterium]